MGNARPLNRKMARRREDSSSWTTTPTASTSSGEPSSTSCFVSRIQRSIPNDNPLLIQSTPYDGIPLHGPDSPFDTVDSFGHWNIPDLRIKFAGVGSISICGLDRHMNRSRIGLLPSTVGNAAGGWEDGTKWGPTRCGIARVWLATVLPYNALIIVKTNLTSILSIQ